MYTNIHFLMDCILTSILIRIHPNLKSTVYCAAIAFGGVEEWDFAWRMFKNATLASEASRLRSAMACTKVPWLLNRYVKQPDLWECPCSRFSLNETSANVQHCQSYIGFLNCHADNSFHWFSLLYSTSNTYRTKTDHYILVYYMLKCRANHGEEEKTELGVPCQLSW